MGAATDWVGSDWGGAEEDDLEGAVLYLDVGGDAEGGDGIFEGLAQGGVVTVLSHAYMLDSSGDTDSKSI